MFSPLLFEDIAFSEIMVILLVVLLFFGSKSIPGIAKTLGKTLYEFRNAQAEIQREIQRSGMDIKKEMNLSELIKEKAEEIKQPLDQIATEINNTIEFKSTSHTAIVENEFDSKKEDPSSSRKEINTNQNMEP
jgi:sec-independent protein translocase protein TatA